MENNEVIKDIKIAIISDIHGNYHALDAVISDISKKDINYTICLGDIIGKGVNSRKCIDLVKEKCDIVLKGNVDDRFCMNPEDFKQNEREYERIKFYRNLLTQEDIKYLNNLPLCTEFYLSGNLVRLFHASPNDPYKTIDNYEMDFNKKYKLFEPEINTSNTVADIIVFGHLHYNILEKLYGKTLINCGSVGCSGCPILKDEYNSSNEISNAHYLILRGNLNDKNNGKIEFSFESVPYEKENEIIESTQLGNIEDGYEELLRNGYYPGLPDVMNKISEKGFKLLR